MSEFKFNCPTCGQHLAAAATSVGQRIQCPSCQKIFEVPTPVPPGLKIAGRESGSSGGAASEEPTGRFCVKCGKPVSLTAAFCAACGQPTGQNNPGTRFGTGATTGENHGLSENIAGALCYVGFWITGLIFLLIDKRPFVKFHAAQSLVAFLGLMVLRYLFGFLFGFIISMSVRHTSSMPVAGQMPGSVVPQMPDMNWMHWLAMFGYINYGFYLVALIAWVLCIISAMRGERYQLPIAGEIAEGIAAK